MTATDPAIVVRDVTVTFRPLIDKKPTLRKSLGRMRHREKETSSCGHEAETYGRSV